MGARRMRHLPVAIRMRARRMRHLPVAIRMGARRMRHLQVAIRMGARRMRHLQVAIRMGARRMRHLQDAIRMGARRMRHLQDAIRMGARRMRHLQDAIRMGARRMRHLQGCPFEWELEGCRTPSGSHCNSGSMDGASPTAPLREARWGRGSADEGLVQRLQSSSGDRIGLLRQHALDRASIAAVGGAFWGDRPRAQFRSANPRI